MNKISKLDYEILTKGELIKKYNKSYASIQQQAHRDRFKRPKKLNKYGIIPDNIKQEIVKIGDTELMADIAKKFNISPTSVRALLLKNGIAPLCFKEVTKAELFKYYTEDHLSQIEIAKLCKVSQSHISKKIIEYNLTKDKETINELRITTNLTRYNCAFPNKLDCKTERTMQDWLNSFGFNFNSNTSILKNKEIDLYDDSLKLGIEYCGLFWHTEDSPSPRGNTYHNDKRKNCEAAGVRLITIFEDEWLSRPAQVKGFLKAVLKKNSVCLAARKCVVTDIAKSTAMEFLEKYHIQGAAIHSKLFAGLIYNDELVGVLTFGAHPRDSKILVLDRLCFKEDVTVIGGASKLFKYLLNKSGKKEIISWSDNRWSVGAVYKQLGFVLAEELPPDYSYVDFKKAKFRHSKQSQKKSAVKCPAGKTELEWANERGLHRIWDCGKKRWLFKLEDVK